MKFEKGTSKEQKLLLLKDEMKKIAGQLGMVEMGRQAVVMGKAEYSSEIGAKRRAELRREFGKLQAQHKRLYFS